MWLCVLFLVLILYIQYVLLCTVVTSKIQNFDDSKASANEIIKTIQSKVGYYMAAVPIEVNNISDLQNLFQVINQPLKELQSTLMDGYGKIASRKNQDERKLEWKIAQTQVGRYWA